MHSAGFGIFPLVVAMEQPAMWKKYGVPLADGKRVPLGDRLTQHTDRSETDTP
jgi:hypothetical protein